MSWYKKAIDIGDLEDRNIVNDTIHFFEELTEALEDLSKIVFQDAKIARMAARDIFNSKKLSSYPLIADILREADIKALDSPWTFAELCKEAIDEIGIRINKLKKQRSEFTNEELPYRMKGWVDSHG